MTGRQVDRLPRKMLRASKILRARQTFLPERGSRPRLTSCVDQSPMAKTSSTLFAMEALQRRRPER